MAKKTKVVVVCDRHRGEVEATTSLEIAFDGERTKLDLCAEHATELRRTLRPWLRASSPTTRSTRGSGTKAAGRRRSASPRRSTDGPAIRAWAKENGYDIPERGRIPAAVREAYASAN